MTVSRALPLLIGAALSLAGCMKDPLAGLSRNPDIKVELFGGFAGTPPAPVTLPPDAPRLVASLYQRDIAGDVALVARRGTVTEWMANDGVTIRLDGGILVGTTGLGRDLYAADAASLMAAMAAGGGSYARDFRFMDGERRIVLTSAECTLTRPTGTQEYTELCRTGQGTFTNRFQTDPATGDIIASRQWISHEAGYLGLNPKPNS